MVAKGLSGQWPAGLMNGGTDDGSLVAADPIGNGGKN
jgi:hypothetical protein